MKLAIGPELEESRKASSTLFQSTWTLAAIKWVLCVVLPQTCHSIEGESLTEFNHSYQPDRYWQMLSDMFQCALLLFSRLIPDCAL